MKQPHPALRSVFEERDGSDVIQFASETLGVEHVTSLSLARALAVGCLSRLGRDRDTINIWDPTTGAGIAGSLLANALNDVGTRVSYRGQDISEETLAFSRGQFHSGVDAKVAIANTLEEEPWPGFQADLVVVDPPWGASWRQSEAVVKQRSTEGTFGFGLPELSDSLWLYVSLAIEKLRPASEGGGRVAALVHPGALSGKRASASIRRRIVDAGVLESVTRLPFSLAPNTEIPLYLLTFSNVATSKRDQVQLGDLQAHFVTVKSRRALTIAALEELERGLRTWKSGPLNRSANLRQFTRREVKVERATPCGRKLRWHITTHNDTPIDEQFLAMRYGQSGSPTIIEACAPVIDLNPGSILRDSAKDVVGGIRAQGWESTRLSGLLTDIPIKTDDAGFKPTEDDIYIPSSNEGVVSMDSAVAQRAGRVFTMRLNRSLVSPSYLSGWLNSDLGLTSRRRATEVVNAGQTLPVLRSDQRSLLRWADEVIVPLPDAETQFRLASTEEQLTSFEAELARLKDELWVRPEEVELAVGEVALAFDSSLESWLDQLPFPIASALWTAGTRSSMGEKQRAYVHAWEAIVAFHASLVLSALRNDRNASADAEEAVRRSLEDNGLSMERASFGTWVVLFEKISKEIRILLEMNDRDEVARVQRMFAGLSISFIERLVSKNTARIFTEVNRIRNQWFGHSGFQSDEAFSEQVLWLTSQLRELRNALGRTWNQLILVRAGSASKGREGIVQNCEIAMGTRSPFARHAFAVGEFMIDGELYFVTDKTETPLRLCQFVQLRSAPSSAQYTSFFYNRMDGAEVRMVSYQYGPESERREALTRLRDDLGRLLSDVSA